MNRKPISRSGFTLVEMLVVIAILAIVTTITLPSFRSDNEDEITKAANTLTNLLARSRQTAIERGEPVSLIIEPATSRYWAIETAREGGDSLLSSGALSLPPDAMLGAERSRVSYTFLPTGGGFGDSVSLRLGAHTAVVSLDRWTGDANAQAR